MTIAKSILAVWFSLGLIASGGDQKEHSRARALVAQLDDESFAIRESAAAQLAKLGESALPVLVEASGSDSPDQRARVWGLLHAMRASSIERGFRAMGQQTDSEIDLELGMCLIAQMLDPEVCRDQIAARLDQMAADVQKSIGEGVDPKSLPGSEIVGALCEVLGGSYSLDGDTENYDHPDNSSIHRVIEQGDGLPILLSEIAVAVARRLDVPIVGIPVPGRYMIKYEGSGQGGDLIVDPFGGWATLAEDEIGVNGRFFNAAEHLEASSRRATLERMLTNLESDFLAVGMGDQAASARRYRALLVLPAEPRVGRGPLAD